ncbi:Hypothetical protein PENO1_009040 [Penicillium occitanis (nom. inval.)]|nr:Hypothetical protein PENO1_009040 [Penicillium occitanis (nom. inval.)]PCH10043.1 hypothetical protein PENOC_005680 [Penicillium occitanis (nom. inval.)]
MSNQREGTIPDWDLEEHFLSAQQLSQRLATVVEGEGNDAFRSTRPSTTTSFPPRSSSMPTAAQPAPLFATQRTAPAVGETESPFAHFRPSTSTSGPSRPSSNTAILDRAVSIVENARPGRSESRSLPPGVWLMTDPPRLYRPSPIPQSPPAYSAPEVPASTTASLPPGLPSNSTPTQRTTLDSRPETQSQTTEEERACCLPCAKIHNICIPRQSQLKERCFRCRHMNIACIPIPAEHLPGYLAIQPLFQEGRIIDGNMALNAWNDSMEATTDPFVRIERQLFLLNRNVERLLNAQLSRNGQPALRFIEEEFPEK